MDSDIVRMLKERICRHKAELRTFFDGGEERRGAMGQHTRAAGHARDGGAEGRVAGRVSEKEWAAAMSSVLHLEIPWLKYRPWLDPKSSSNPNPNSNFYPYPSLTLTLTGTGRGWRGSRRTAP